MFAKYMKNAISRTIPSISRSVLPASAMVQHQGRGFTVYTGYGKTTPDLEAIHDKWIKLYNSRDVDGLGNLYAKDCTIMPSGDESISGQLNAKKFFASRINQVSEVIGHLDEAAPMDKDAEMAFIRGTYTYLNIGDGDDVVDDGKNVLILKKEDGEWKVYIDIWSSNHTPHL
eukprot:80138_1